MKIRLLIPLLLVFLTACAAEQTPSPPTASPTPRFDSAKYGTAELNISYCATEDDPADALDQSMQQMDVYYPVSGGLWPVFLYVHGGSWMEGDKAEGEGWRGLTDQGYLVVSLNYRMAPIHKFPAMIEDLKCAVRFLRAHASDYNLDPERFAALGASAGGHLVALMGTADEAAGWDAGEFLEYSSRIQAVISIAGFFDFTKTIKTGVATPIYSAFGALLGTSSPKLVIASPVTYITPDDPPFLILHGDRDNIAPLEQSVWMDEQLQASGVPSDVVVVTGGDHGLQGPEVSHSSEEIYQTILGFLNLHLK